MSICKINRHERDFTIIHNPALADERLSFKARGLLAYLLSKPDTWQVSMRQLARVGPDGATSVRNAMRELVDNGYAKLETHRDENNLLKGRIYNIYEDSQTGNGPIMQETVKTVDVAQVNTESNKTESNKTDSDSPCTSPKGDSPIEAQVNEVFEHHCIAMSDNGTPKPWRLGAKGGSRYRKIAKRLKEFTVDELKTAIDNLSKSDWHRGQNDDNKPVNGPEFLYRNEGRVREWLEKDMSIVPKPKNTAPANAAVGKKDKYANVPGGRAR